MSRFAAFERAGWRLVPGLVALSAGAAVVGRLDFTPNPVTNRITEFSLAVLMIPVIVTGFVLSWTGFKTLTTACWPKPLRIVADEHAITFHLGPFESARFNTASLELKYPFELSIDGDDAADVYESLLPEEHQLAHFLPRIQHPIANERLDRRILRYTRLTEQQAANALRPFTEHIHNAKATDHS